MTEKSPKNSLSGPDIATRIMERMVRMPPKLHKEMKLGKRKAKAADEESTPKKAILAKKHG